MPMTLDTIQYSGRPLGSVIVKKANMNGIIHSIMRWVDCWRGSAFGITLIFCMTHMEAPTRNAITGGKDVSGRARSSQRK